MKSLAGLWSSGNLSQLEDALDRSRGREADMAMELEDALARNRALEQMVRELKARNTAQEKRIAQLEARDPQGRTAVPCPIHARAGMTFPRAATLSLN